MERQYGWDLISEQYVNRLSVYSESAMNQSLSSDSVTLQGAQLSTSELSSNNDINQIPRLQFLEGFGEQGINRNLFFRLLYVEYDYSGISYPIPFNTLYNSVSSHYVHFGAPFSSFGSFVQFGSLPKATSSQSDMLFITGASENHAICSFNCLYSMLLADPYASLLYIDYGVSSIQLRYLVAHMETLHQIQDGVRSKGFIGYRRFNWASFPRWMHINNEADRGGYSWKIVAIKDAFFEWKGLVSWMDGGNIITDSITREVTAARSEGVYSATSSGTVGQWVHKGMISFVLENHLVKRIDPQDSMAMGGVLYFDYAKSISHSFLVKLSECCYTKKCISPRGSSRQNHRQDQAIISLLLHDYGFKRAGNKWFNYHPSLRNEYRNDPNVAKQALINMMVLIQQMYHVQFNNSIYSTQGMEYKPVKYSYTSRTMNDGVLIVCYSLRAFYYNYFQNHGESYPNNPQFMGFFCKQSL